MKVEYNKFKGLFIPAELLKSTKLTPLQKMLVVFDDLIKTVGLKATNNEVAKCLGCTEWSVRMGRKDIEENYTKSVENQHLKRKEPKEKTKESVLNLEISKEKGARGNRGQITQYSNKSSNGQNIWYQPMTEEEILAKYPHISKFWN